MRYAACLNAEYAALFTMRLLTALYFGRMDVPGFAWVTISVAVSSPS
jgi:hypothetical protein